MSVQTILAAVWTQVNTVLTALEATVKADAVSKVLPIVATFVSDVQAAGTDPLAFQLAWIKFQAAFNAQLPALEHDLLSTLLSQLQAQIIALVTPTPAAPVVAAVAAKAA
jgi:hypothetical protein